MAHGGVRAEVLPPNKLFIQGMEPRRASPRGTSVADLANERRRMEMGDKNRFSETAKRTQLVPTAVSAAERTRAGT